MDCERGSSATTAAGGSPSHSIGTLTLSRDNALIDFAAKRIEAHVDDVPVEFTSL